MLTSALLASMLLTQPVAATSARHPQMVANDHLLGSKSAEIIMIEYAGLQDPYSKMIHPSLQHIVAEYEGQVAWVYRHFPFSFHPYSQIAAEASECAYTQGRNDAFWKYIDLVYEKQDKLNEAMLKKIASDMQLNMDKFNRCITKHQTSKRIDRDIQRGNNNGISGTPTVILIKRDGTKKEIIGAQPIDSLRMEIDALLAS